MIFLKTVVERSEVKVRPLSGQRLTDGKAINPSWNVRCDKGIRSLYATGTIFVVDSLLVDTNFYTAKGDMRVVSKDANPVHMASPAEFGQLEELLTTAPSTSPPPKASTSKGGSPMPPPRSSYLERLKSNNRVPTIEECGLYISPETWFLLLRNIKNQINTMLVGPTGTGKTELVTLVGETLGLPTHDFDMGSMHDPIPTLLGTHRLEAGESVFDYSRFTEIIQKPGIGLLDELSRAPVTTNNILFPTLDKRRRLPVEIAAGHGARSIPVHKDFSFVATANIGAEYTGTMTLDRALAGRFFVIELDYLDSIHESKVLMKRAGIDVDEATKIVAAANNIRKQAKKQALSASVSTRETLMAAEMVKDGWTVIESLEACFLPLFEGNKSEGERSTVYKIFATS